MPWIAVIYDNRLARSPTIRGRRWARSGVAAKRRLASRRPGVMFVDAPTAVSKGPAQQEQLLILNRQVGSAGMTGGARRGRGVT